MTNKRILVSRHGRTTANQQRVIQGWASYGLSDDGRAAVEAARTWWRAQSIGHVVSSPLLRARETALLLFGQFDELDAAFTESANPVLEGVPYAEVRASHAALFDTETGWPRADRPPSPLTESRAVVASRAMTGLRRVAAAAPTDPRAVAVVSHGEVLLALLSEVGVDLPKLPNLTVVEFLVKPSGKVHSTTLIDPIAGTETPH